MRHVYKKAALNKGGLFDFSQGSIPDYALEEIECGKAAAVWDAVTEREDGHRFYYSKDSLVLQHTAYVFPKNSWLKVQGVYFRT